MVRSIVARRYDLGQGELMRRKIPRVAGTVSVLGFAALLGFIFFSIVQGQEAPKEEERPPGLHPLEGFGPEDLPATPNNAMPHEFSVEIGIDEVEIDCTSGSPRLKLRTREPLPPGAEVVVAPRGSPIERPSGSLRYPAAGESQRIGVPEAASVVDAELPSIDSQRRLRAPSYMGERPGPGRNGADQCDHAPRLGRGALWISPIGRELLLAVVLAW